MRRTGIACFTCLLLAGRAITAEMPLQMPLASPDQPTLDYLDQGIASMRQLPWALPGMAGNPPADETGRRMQDDLAEYYLAEPVLAKITALRDGLAASTAPGAQIPAAKFAPLERLLRSEHCRLMVISAYWSRRGTYQYHRNLIQPLIEHLPESARPEASQELRAIEARGAPPRSQWAPSMQFCTDLTQESKSAELATSMPPLLAVEPLVDEYNALRLKLVAGLNAANGGAELARQSTKRSTPCPAPATTTSGRRGPAVRSAPDVRKYYPEESTRFSVTGSAKVWFAYDKSGCVIETSIAESTGSEVLDAAAMRVAFDMKLNPGEVDGRPAEGAAVLPVNFNIRDIEFAPDTPSPPTQTQP